MREIAFTDNSNVILPCTIHERDAQNHSMNDSWQLEFCDLDLKVVLRKQQKLRNMLPESYFQLLSTSTTITDARVTDWGNIKNLG